MPLADLVSALQRDADREARAAADAAGSDVARIAAESARQCSLRLAAAVRDATEHARARARMQLAELALSSRRGVLDARAAMLERLRDAVRAVLPSLVDAELRDQLATAAATYGTGTRRDTPTGVVVELADGTRIDATLDAALDRGWRRLAGEAVMLVDRGSS